MCWDLRCEILVAQWFRASERLSESHGFDPRLRPTHFFLRQDPLEAILVIFGRRVFIFFLFESSWKKMKNDATFVRMRSGDHLGDAKMSKKGTSLRRI